MRINKIVVVRSITIALWLAVSIASIFVNYDENNSKYIPDLSLLLSGLCFFSFSILILILELIKVNNHKGWITFVNNIFNKKI